MPVTTASSPRNRSGVRSAPVSCVTSQPIRASACRHIVARAGDVTDFVAANGHFEAQGFEARGRLQQLGRDMIVFKFHPAGVPIHAADIGDGQNFRRAGLGRSGDGENQPRAPA
jgi:hypothetical protein